MENENPITFLWAKFWASMSLLFGGLTLSEAHAVVAFLAQVVGLLTGLWLLAELVYKRLIKRVPVGDTQKGDL